MFDRKTVTRANIQLVLLMTGWLAIFAPSCFGKDSFSTTQTFSTNAQLEANNTELTGTIAVTYESAEPIYRVSISAKSTHASQSLAIFDYWTPGANKVFTISLPSEHSVPGRYHLLITIDYSDASSNKVQTSFGVEYAVNEKNPGEKFEHSNATRPPSFHFQDNTIHWVDVRPNQHTLNLEMTAGPFWRDEKRYTIEDHTVEFVALSNLAAPPQTAFQQVARITWEENGTHQSELQTWSIVTDKDGKPHATDALLANGPIQSTPVNWLIPFLAIFFLATTVLFRGFRISSNGPTIDSKKSHDWLGALGITALTAFLFTNIHPELLFNGAWTTGGDTASHAFYAKVFTDWFWSGKFSGWLPESFAGFPAFTFYFPFPFSLTALLSVPLGIKSAFAFVSSAPAVLLPAATYIMLAMMRWSLPARGFATLGATAFLLTTKTTFWGGNALATFTGEFAYGWGMLASALFLGILHKALSDGGRIWILAALAEAVVALCHGYPLLVIGFGSFAALFTSAKPLSTLRTLLQVHTLAFLLIAAWLFPLIENLPWTIPNDTPVWIDDLSVLWPRELWPFAVGLIAAGFVIWKKRFDLGGFGLLAGFALASYIGFSVADRTGLAATRFFPLLQWSIVILLGGAIGTALCHWNRQPILWVITASFATLWWCSPGLNQSSDWAQWNLSGYEAKPLWPVFQKVAAQLEGPNSAPRVLFEHDPDNTDTGSTRTLEAFPLFGTRPMLEGLYMEAAITVPFIYQVQAEISAKPSSPSSRFPSVTTSASQAIAHMKELYADTLLLRSDSMKDRFRHNTELEVVAEIEPFLILKIKDFSQQLIEPITTPLTMAPQKDWIEDAFSRFRLAHPYQARQVYLPPDVTGPASVLPKENAKSTLIEFDRERLVFETNAIGQPHLIRMTYHPRWRSTTGEPIFLTEPSFMLVVPQHARMEIVFGDSLATKLGGIASILGIIFLTGAILFPRWASPHPQKFAQYHRASWLVLGTFIFTITLGTTLWWSSSERAYQAAFQLYNKRDYLAAAPLFEQAEEGRRLVPWKAEALFWAARNYELGSDRVKARALYEAFRARYMSTYSYPEVAFRLIQLDLEDKKRDEALHIFAELEKFGSENKWTVEARSVLFPK